MHEHQWSEWYEPFPEARGEWKLEERKCSSCGVTKCRFEQADSGVQRAFEKPVTKG